MDLFGGIDLSGILDAIPSVDNILSNIGERLNNSFQFLAESANKIPIIGSKLAGFFSGAGVNIADFFGANNISKFNPDTGQKDVLMENGQVTQAGIDVGLGSREVEQAKSTATSNYVSAPNVNAGDYSTNIQTTTKVNMPKAKPDPSVTLAELEAEGMYI